MIIAAITASWEPPFCFFHKPGADQTMDISFAPANAVHRQVLMSEREKEQKTGALACFAGDAHLAAMELDQLVHKGQTNTRSFIASAPSTFNPMKALKKPRQLRFFDTHT